MTTSCRGNKDTLSLTLEVDFFAVLQAFFYHPSLVFTPLRISWKDPVFG
jgi:hypothetical protein